MLQRFEGTLLPGGNKVAVNFQMSPNPGTPTVALPLAMRVTNKTLWNEKVNFVVGLGMFGIFAYDATVETIDVLKAHAFEMPQRGQTPTREPSVQQAEQATDIYQYHDRMQPLLFRWRYLNDQLSRCQDRSQVMIKAYHVDTFIPNSKLSRGSISSREL